MEFEMSDQVEAQSPEERMLALVEADDSFADAEPPEEVPVDEENADDSVDPDADETEGDEAPEPRVLKLKHNGEEVDKTEEEVIALAQQGFDYTQKTQQLAEERRQIESQAQAIKANEQAFQQQVQLQTALIQDIAEITAIDKQLAQYQNLDWNSLSNNDPVEAQKLFFSYNQLQTQRGQLANQLDGKHREITNQQTQAFQQVLAENRAIVERDIPNWAEVKPKLKQVGKEYGFSDQELSSIVDARQLKILHDAMKYRELQASKPGVQNKVSQAKPVVKPGAKDGKTAQTANVKQTREALRKTGRSEHAAKLIENML
jgi:hypothetical protein